MKLLRSFRFNSAGFTLLELLTALLILAIVTAVLGKMAGMASATWMGGRRQSDNFTKARAMLELLARDTRAGIFRDDLAAFPISSGSVTVAFYTKRPGISTGTSTRNVSLVKYELDGDSSTFTLLRGENAILWSDAAMAISFANTTTLSGSVTMRDASPGIVGFRTAFIRADGTFFQPAGSGSAVFPCASNPVRAISFALAVIDEQSIKQSGSSSLTQLRNGLKDVELSGTQSTTADWEAYLDAHRSLYPKTITSNLKFFERYVLLP